MKALHVGIIFGDVRDFPNLFTHQFNFDACCPCIKRILDELFDCRAHGGNHLRTRD